MTDTQVVHDQQESDDAEDEPQHSTMDDMRSLGPVVILFFLVLPLLGLVLRPLVVLADLIRQAIGGGH